MTSARGVVTNSRKKVSRHRIFTRSLRTIKSASRNINAIILNVIGKVLLQRPLFLAHLFISPVVFWPRRGDLISPGLVVAWQTNSQRYLEPSARVGGARAHIRSRLA